MAEDGAVTSSGRAWTRPLTYQIIKSATIHDRDTSGGDEPRFHTKHIRWRRRCRPPRSVESEQRHPEDSDASSGQGQVSGECQSQPTNTDQRQPAQQERLLRPRSPISSSGGKRGRVWLWYFTRSSLSELRGAWLWGH